MGDANLAEQTWSPATYQRHAGFVSAYGQDVLEWLELSAGERVLDLGCGEGTLASIMAERGAHVVGVDTSAAFVDATRAKGIDAHLADGHALQFDTEFDAVFSNAALHWMLRPAAVIDGVRRALKPGGRFVGEFGCHGNVAAIVTAMRALAPRYGIDAALACPWFFPTPARYEALLTAGGFAVTRLELIPRPTPLPGAMTAWLETFRAPFFDAAGERRAELLAETEALLAPALRDDEGRWTADYVRLRFSARCP